MATDLESLIKRAISKKQGNKEFALFYFDFDDGNKWFADIGNPSACVMLGEVEGDFKGKGKTPCEAVVRLIEELEQFYGD